MANPDYWRQLGIVSTDELNRNKVTVIGAGGIGSPTILALAKMGVNHITVYDPDMIENHNLPNQLYRKADIGKKKVDALKEIISEYAEVCFVGKAEYFINQPVSGVVISGVDSMKSRKVIWDQVKYNSAVPLYIEARMGAQFIRVLTLNPSDPDFTDWYEKTLYRDEEAQELPCTQRAIIYTVFATASLICGQLKKFVKREAFPKEINLDLANLFLLKS